jgi:hypothetical protein
MSNHFDSSDTISHEVVAIGAIDRAGNYARYFTAAAALRASAPVFVAPIDDTLMNHISGRAILRMGVIPLPTGGVMFFIRMQSNDTQFVWLADATDQETWRALDAFRKTRQAGFGFRSGEQLRFTPYETDDTSAILERFRSEIGRKDRLFIEAATGLIACGNIPETFDTMRRGVKVNHYRVCILGTARLKAALAERGGMDVPLPAAEGLMKDSVVVAAPAAVQ